MSDGGSEKRGRGRPKSEGGGRGSTLTISIAPQTRAALEEASAAIGRSLSQTAELAMERGQIFGALGDAGPAVASVMQEMLIAAKATVETLGAPTASKRARDDLRKRWVQIAQAALPNIADAPPWQQAANAAISAMRHAAIDARLPMSPADAEANDTIRVCAKHLRQIANAKAYPGSPDWPAVEADLEAAAVETGGDFAEDVQAVLSLARAADRAVKRAESRK